MAQWTEIKVDAQKTLTTRKGADILEKFLTNQRAGYNTAVWVKTGSANRDILHSLNLVLNSFNRELSESKEQAEEAAVKKEEQDALAELGIGLPITVKKEKRKKKKRKLFKN